jgi:hypothetical protein
MSDERFDYARKQLNAAAESSAEHITWVICQETGKHIGNDVSERLAREIESFLRN